MKWNVDTNHYVYKSTDMIFGIGLFVYFFESILRITTIPISIPNRLCQLFVIICSFVTVIIHGKVSKKALLLKISVILLALVVYSIIDRFDLLLLIALVIAAQYVSEKHIIKTALVMHLFFLIVCTILSAIGAIQNYCYDDVRGVRQSLGYLSYNYPSKVVFFCIMYYLYLKKGKLKLIEISAMVICSVLYCIETNSRSTMYIIPFIIVLDFLLEKYHDKIFNLRYSFFICYTFVFMAVISIGVELFYMNEPEKLQVLDQWTTHRLSITANTINEYGWSLFGNRIVWTGVSNSFQAYSQYNFVDCSYINVLLNYGLIFTVCLIAGFTKLMKVALSSHNHRLILVLFAIALRSVIEPQLIDVRFNTFILLILPAYIHFSKNSYN